MLNHDFTLFLADTKQRVYFKQLVWLKHGRNLIVKKYRGKSYLYLIFREVLEFRGFLFFSLRETIHY